MCIGSGWRCESAECRCDILIAAPHTHRTIQLFIPTAKPEDIQHLTSVSQTHPASGIALPMPSPRASTLPYSILRLRTTKPSDHGNCGERASLPRAYILAKHWPSETDKVWNAWPFSDSCCASFTPLVLETPRGVSAITAFLPFLSSAILSPYSIVLSEKQNEDL
jgi:hypothetical protein